MTHAITPITKPALVAWLILALSGAALAAMSSTGAGESRIYEVRVDNKPAGNYKLELRPTASGIDVVSHCEVNFKVLLIRFRYLYDGHEVWTGKNLSSLDSNCQDGLKHVRVSAIPEGQLLKLTVNGTSSQVAGDTLPSSYWHLPSDRSPSGRFIEVDSGRVFNAQLNQQGTESLAVGDHTQQCKHYKVTGGDSGDLWYDQENRLVRQISQSDGHTTTVQLTQINKI